ncbi:hypothetical protein J6590_062504 [Homalodisca vitripennis]|nr:hypothetical protein J6590_062504 [Homalodisca vitripennis]
MDQTSGHGNRTTTLGHGYDNTTQPKTLELDKLNQAELSYNFLHVNVTYWRLSVIP